MQPISILMTSSEEPNGYENRPTVKAVVIDEDGYTLLFGLSLLGGGVEEGESLEEAIHRECLEEAGILVEIIAPLGEVIQYRDALKKRHEIQGFLVRFLHQQSEPTTTQAREMNRSLTWLTFNEAESMLEKRIAEVEEVRETYSAGDAYQSALYSATTALVFLREAKKVFPRIKNSTYLK